MNILPIIPKLHNSKDLTNKNSNNNTVLQPKYSHTLVEDTVSFSGSTSKISDFVARSISNNMNRLESLATIYLDVLESVALKLKDYGVSFDRIYCEQNPVKSPESYASKVVRSGNFKVPDTIRATLYMKNPSDLSILNDKIIPEMKKRGYILGDTDMKYSELLKRGFIPDEPAQYKPSKIFKVPDLDIRLENASENITKLAPELKYSIGKPQKFGYEDIQMRFIKEFDKKNNTVQHELIILFGPNYAKAKHLESEKVYSNLRLFNELNMKFEDKTIGSHSLKANRYVDLIKQMFTGKVSEKLFLNAKNKDLYDISDEIPISFSEMDMKMFENYFSGLREKLASCYKEKQKNAKASAMASKQLQNYLRQDKNILNSIHDNLYKTIEYFNNKTGLKETID